MLKDSILVSVLCCDGMYCVRCDGVRWGVWGQVWCEDVWWCEDGVWCEDGGDSRSDVFQYEVY